MGVIGGNDAILVQLIKTLQSEGHDITLFTFSKPPKEKFPGIEIKSKIPIHLPLLGLYKNWLMPKFDYSNYEIVLSMTGLDVDCKCPLIIYDQNNLGNEFDMSHVPIKYQKGFWKYYYLPYKKFNKKEVNSNAKYVSNSIYSGEKLFSFVNSKIEIIYPPVDIDNYSTWENKEKQIVMVARISPEKNLEFAVDVLNHVHYPSLILGNVSSTNKPYYNKLKKMCESHVKILSDPLRVNLEKRLQQSKVYFHASEETFGISVVEAIASSCIPIVPNNTAHPETVPVDELRYTPNDVDSAVSKLCNAMTGNYDHRIDALRKHVRNFGLPVFENNIRDLLK